MGRSWWTHLGRVGERRSLYPVGIEALFRVSLPPYNSVYLWPLNTANFNLYLPPFHPTTIEEEAPGIALDPR